MPKNFWDSVASKYERSVHMDTTADFAYERQVNSLSILSLCDNYGIALDLGCGDGRFTKDLTSRYKNVYGIDYSIKMLNIAKVYCPEANFNVCNLEMDFPKLDVKVDLVVCKLLLMYIKNIDTIAHNSFEVLNKNGLVVVSVTHPLKWISEHQMGNIINENYLGYLSETEVNWKIANDKDLAAQFINRTMQTYINTFTKYGFKLETVVETGVPDTFVIKYPSYLPFQKKPYRLNLKFVKP